MTLDDLEGHWQPVQSAIIATTGLLVIVLLCNSHNKTKTALQTLPSV